MYNVGVAFEILDEGVHVPHRWKQVTGHLVWDVKMDFTRKARWVPDGHKTLDPIGSTYAGVVSRESVQIALTYAALNDLDFLLPTSRMLIYNPHHHKRTTLFVAQSLELRTLGEQP